MGIDVYNLKYGDMVILNNDDYNVYEIFYYCNIGNGYVCKCGKRFSGSLILRFATDEEIKAGRRL